MKYALLVGDMTRGQSSIREREEFEQCANELLAEGWRVQGGVSVAAHPHPSPSLFLLAQAFVLPEAGDQPAEGA